MTKARDIHLHAEDSKRRDRQRLRAEVAERAVEMEVEAARRNALALRGDVDAARQEPVHTEQDRKAVKTFDKETTRIYLKSGLLVGCSTAMLYLVLSFVKWLLKEIEHQGFVATAAQLNRWVLDNPISIAWLCIALVLFNLIVMPYVLAALEDRDSFLSRLSVLVVGSLVVIGVASLVVLTIRS